MKRTNEQELTLEEALCKPTNTVPDIGRLFFDGMSRNASYGAAKRGEIITIEVGRRKLALTRPNAEKVGLQVKF